MPTLRELTQKMVRGEEPPPPIGRLLGFCLTAIEPGRAVCAMVCLQSFVPEGVRCEVGWRCLRVAGAMDFSQVGILASLVGPLAKPGISISAISTFDPDYLLVKDGDLEKATTALKQAGHSIL